MFNISDVHYIFVIASFWLIYSASVTAWANDPVIGVSVSEDFNSSVGTSAFNNTMSETDTTTRPTSFLRTFFQLLTFGLPNVSTGISIFISGINWLLVAITALLIYRQVRSGGG